MKLEKDQKEEYEKFMNEIEVYNLHLDRLNKPRTSATVSVKSSLRSYCKGAMAAAINDPSFLEISERNTLPKQYWEGRSSESFNKYKGVVYEVVGDRNEHFGMPLLTPQEQKRQMRKQIEYMEEVHEKVKNAKSLQFF